MILIKFEVIVGVGMEQCGGDRKVVGNQNIYFFYRRGRGMYKFFYIYYYRYIFFVNGYGYVYRMLIMSKD